MSMTTTTTKNNETTVLVTGATGTVGSEVVKQLTSSFSSSSGSRVKSELFIRKIRLTNSRMKTKQLRLLIWIIINQKLLLML